ncbi:hypothetical protein Mpsy_0320 [Methanolobus psychrophilus R15]|nr:hypothetical protein Mpsy_0320 [Methanolobus psychrophilus R15]
MTSKQTILRAVHRTCLACCGNSRRDVLKCKVFDCSLHPYRNGTDPNPNISGGKLRSVYIEEYEEDPEELEESEARGSVFDDDD